MSLFSIFKKPAFFNPKEQEGMVQAIQEAERRTSGEIRVFIESKCKYVHPLDRAVEIFYGLKMEKTVEKNAVLVYLATKDHQLAIFADEGIHKKTGKNFWKDQVQLMLGHFNKDDYAAGIIQVINHIGEALHEHFPYKLDTDKNELPDDIIFGK
ncbi:MAG: TPM domain-containing protein [Chitinophagaceae bacterium]